MNKLLGKKVEVVTVDIVYMGILIEINESEICLQAAEGWITVPVEKVVSVKAI